MDSIYIRKVLNGDANAFRYFIDQYRDMAYSLAVSMVKNDAVAEEVVQDAFLKAYRALGNFEQRSKFSTWLYKIVTNEALKRLKKKKLDYVRDIQEINEQQFANVNDSIQTLATDDQRRYINIVLDKLSPNDSLILRLFYLNENSLKEIQEITGFSDNKIKTILHRGRKRFYTLLELELKNELKTIL